MDYPKRLIEVDLPIKRISAHARREKSIRHGHISTLHLWWARRPLAACRAVICAALWPDPADTKCPQAFNDEARRLMADWAANHLDLTSPESMGQFNRIKNDPKVLTDNVELRKTLLDFIADFANWDNADQPPYIALSQSLTRVAHHALGGDPGTVPLVVDPFAGGGAIPFESLRVGCDSFASDLNPIPVLLNTVALQHLPAHSQSLAAAVPKWADWIRTEAAHRLGSFYPTDPDGGLPIAYLWARTIRCEGPGCGVDVPLLRSLLLANRRGGKAVALVMTPDSSRQTICYSLAEKHRDGWRFQTNSASPDTSSRLASVNLTGTVKRGSATCPCCGYTTPVARVREQLKSRRGGSSDSRMHAVVTTRPGESGRFYRLPTDRDVEANAAAAGELRRLCSRKASDISRVPEEQLDIRGIRHTWAMIYGLDHWGDLFTPRQALSLTTLVDLLSEVRGRLAPNGNEDETDALITILALGISRLTDICNALCSWSVNSTQAVHLFGRQAIPMLWDFAETSPFSDAAGDYSTTIRNMMRFIETVPPTSGAGRVMQVSATNHPLPDDSASAFITDPPYYDAVPYAYLSDFFYVWLRRCLKHTYPALFNGEAVPKDPEIVVDRTHELSNTSHDIAYYERELTKAFSEGRRVTRPDGIGTIVFASKSTASWEAMLKAVVDAGWIITGSWPIDTEREARVSAQGQSRLASSVHLVCRPRENPNGALNTETVGDWRTVLAELPKRIHEWMPRLAEEGVVGADAIFACLGPALEIFSRFSRVEKASGDVVTLREYLEQVWAAVSTEALSMIFRDADAAGLESDARFTAIVLWTLNAGGSSGSESDDGDAEDAENEDDDEDSPKGKAPKGGYTLEYDAARKIAQGLGVNLEQIDSVVEVKGDRARLLTVSERAATLFGKAEKVEAPTKKRGKKATQKKLFDKDAEEVASKTEIVTLGEGLAATPGVTALDRVHQAMLLFGDGRADALKRFIAEDGVGVDARFWKLAQSLSALYPAGSDEKRWVDGVLARKKSFGF